MDIVVVGCGPAAFATAIAARRRGLQVTIMGFNDSAPRWGETVPGTCLPVLSRLGIADEVRRAEHLPLQSHLSVWGGGEARERDALFNAYGGGIILDRTRLLRRLEDTFRSEGGYVMEARPNKIERTNDRFQIHLVGRCLSAGMLVDATGSARWVSAHLGVKRLVWARQIAYGVRYEAPPSEILPLTTLVEALENGWLFATPIAAHSAAIWWVTDADIARCTVEKRSTRVITQAEQSIEIARWLRESRLQHTNQRCVRNASIGGLDRVAGDGWIAVGDAALSLDPLSSSGVTMALLSGLDGGAAAAACLVGDPNPLKSYVQTLARVRRSHLVQRRQWHGLEPRWPDAVFWKNQRWYLVSGASARDRS